MNYQPLGIVARFPSMRAHATIQASPEAGNGRFELDGNGMMVFSLQSTKEPDEMSVELLDVRIEFKQTKIEAANFGTFEIPAFTITKSDFDLHQTHGTLYRSNKQVKLQLAVRLDPAHFPILRKLGIYRPETVIATESGILDWEAGRHFETHAEPFKLPSPLDFLTVSPGQFDVCTLEVKLYAGSTCEYAEKERLKEVWICPGDDVCLIWLIDHGSPTKITLDPSGIDVTGSTHEIVNPMDTTEYTVTVESGDCKADDQVTVRVIKEGENILHITAPWSGWGSCIWKCDLPEALFGESVIAVEMRTVLCDGGMSVFPQWGYEHTTPDGEHYSGNVYEEWTDIIDQPVAGEWKFSPSGVDDCTKLPGTTGWESGCFDFRLSCK